MSPLKSHPLSFPYGPRTPLLPPSPYFRTSIQISNFTVEKHSRQNKEERYSNPFLGFPARKTKLPQFRSPLNISFLILQDTQDTLDKGHGTQRIRDFKEKMYAWPWDQSKKCRCHFLLARSPRLLMDIHRWGMSNVVLGVLVPGRFFKNRIRVYFGG